MLQAVKAGLENKVNTVESWAGPGNEAIMHVTIVYLVHKAAKAREQS